MMIEHVRTVTRINGGKRVYRTYWFEGGRIICVPGRQPLNRSPGRIVLEIDFKYDPKRSIDVYVRIAAAHGWTELSALEQLALEAPPLEQLSEVADELQ